MSESRGTGLRPQRPAGWERRPAVPLSGAQAQGPQGPSQLRSAGTPQAPIPGQVVDTLADAPGGFIAQIVAGRPGMANERSRPGDAGNVSGSTGGFPSQNMGGNHLTGGSASPHVTKGRGTF